MGNYYTDVYPDWELRVWEHIPTTLLADADNYYTKKQVDDIIDSIDIPSGIVETVSALTEDVTVISGDVIALSGEVQSNYADLTAHTSNNDIHVTSADKEYWNSKLDPAALDDYYTSAQTDSAIESAVSGKCDTSAITNNYYTSAQTNAAIESAVSGKADNSTVETLSGQVQSNTQTIANKADTSALTAHTSDATIHVTSADKTNWNSKLDASALAPYYTSAQTDSAITQATSGKADTSTVETLSGEVQTLGNDMATVSGDVASKAEYSALTAHTSDSTIHVTSQDKTNWNGKQDLLVSGTNIKTINNVSLLGSGNIDITGGTFTQKQADWNQTDDTAVDYIKNKPTIPSAQDIQTISGDVQTLSGEVQTLSGSVANKVDTSALTAHTSDSTIHVTSANKEYWNAKLDATAYTPTDLSQYWTSAQTNSAITQAVSGKASTSTVETLSGEVQTLSGSVANKADTSALTAHTADTTIHVTSSDKTNWDGKLDATAYTPTDLSQYWTSAQTDSAITQATSGKADTSVVETLSGQVTANTASISNKADTSALTAHTADTTIHVTSADKTNWDGKATTASVQAVDNKFGGMVIVKLTQSQYAALVDKDPDTLYVVVSD